ncbi:uncharacterized protein LOC119831229 [Zerene cesonia]|uniref:uncharacterized protein LOC119831229 n=1 Tax=Zerene cesonia TaxID=33412 RepID=UPI0018E4EB3A|nr:uncharacterized protein LOC119831229 [Zerene cesonia]
MDNSNRTLEDLLNLTDTEESTSSNSGIYESNQPFVLELHEIKKDEPQSEKTEKTPPTDLRIKKRRKKRAQPTVDKSSTSASSLSDSTPKVEDLGKEEFYDANASLHDIPDNQAKPAATVALAQAHSEHGQDPKTDQITTSQRTSASPPQPSAVTKPVVPPDAKQ